MRGGRLGRASRKLPPSPLGATLGRGTLGRSPKGCPLLQEGSPPPPPINRGGGAPLLHMIEVVLSRRAAPSLSLYLDPISSTPKGRSSFLSTPVAPSSG